ncbi:hypothetical protein VTI74DRAFT_3672 [Chaetomium olivicolor]
MGSLDHLIDLSPERNGDENTAATTTEPTARTTIQSVLRHALPTLQTSSQADNSICTMHHITGNVASRSLPPSIPNSGPGG